MILYLFLALIRDYLLNCLSTGDLKYLKSNSSPLRLMTLYLTPPKVYAAINVFRNLALSSS